MNTIGRVPLLFAALIIGAACCFLPSCRKKEPEPEKIVGAAYIDEVLATAESFGQTRKALEYLRSEWEQTPSDRLRIAFDSLNVSQWKETRRVVTVLDGGEEKTFLLYESEYDENGNQLFYVWYEDDGSVSEKVEYAYDAEGNMTVLVRYNPDGSVEMRVEYEYDTSGNLIAETGIHSDPEGEWISSTVCGYDRAGNLISRKAYAEGMFQGGTEYAYDGNGNLILQITTDGNGTVTSRHENTFDSAGSPLSETSFKADGTVSSKKEYAYDEAGRLILEKQSWVRTARTREYEYDGEGLMTRSVYTDEDKRQEYIYDGAGNAVSVTVYRPDGEINFKSESTFDAAGNTLSYVMFGGDGKIIRGYDEILDERGRAISRTNFGEEGVLEAKIENTYDEGGNLIETCVYSFDPKYEKYGYLHRRTEYVREDGALISEIRYAPAGNVAERIDREYAFFPLE